MLAFGSPRFAAWLVLVAALWVPAQAQAGNSRSDRPIVVNVDFTLKRSGERDRELNVSRPLQLASSERLVIAHSVSRAGRR